MTPPLPQRRRRRRNEMNQTAEGSLLCVSVLFKHIPVYLLGPRVYFWECKVMLKTTQCTFIKCKHYFSDIHSIIYLVRAR